MLVLGPNGLLLLGPGGLLADGTLCCCEPVICGCGDICDTVVATLGSDSCACMDALEITLTYGTHFSGTVTGPGGLPYTPEGWPATGWEGSATSGCGPTVTMYLWCVPPVQPASGQPTDYRILLLCAGRAVNIAAATPTLAESSCDPTELSVAIPIDATVGNDYCNCGGGLTLSATATIVNAPGCP